MLILSVLNGEVEYVGYVGQLGIERASCGMILGVYAMYCFSYSISVCRTILVFTF